jgi:hypothetical protein
MNTDVAVVEQDTPAVSPDILENVLLKGDLKDLTAAQRTEYYGAVCRSLGLNPLTKPFEFLTLNNKLVLYARRDCTDQLRRVHGISLYIPRREYLGPAGGPPDTYVVTAQAMTKDGRQDESTGVVDLKGLRGEGLANAMMKAETKAKRRVTLSICGLGWADESEIDSMPSSGGMVAHQATHPTADQVSGLVEMARACGDEAFRNFGRDMGRVMDLPEGTKVTRKMLRDTMTMAQYEAAWDHYRAIVKQQVADSEASAGPLEAAAESPLSRLAEARQEGPQAAPESTIAEGAVPSPSEGSSSWPTANAIDIGGHGEAPMPDVDAHGMVTQRWHGYLLARADKFHVRPWLRAYEAEHGPLSAERWREAWTLVETEARTPMPPRDAR